MNVVSRSHAWIQTLLLVAGLVAVLHMSGCARSAERLAAAGENRCENEEPPLGSRIVRRTPCVQLTLEQRQEQQRRAQEMREEQNRRGPFGPTGGGGS